MRLDIVESKQDISSGKYKILFLNHAINHDVMNDMAELFEMSFMGPLAETEHAEFEILWVGPWMASSNEILDWTFFQRCIEYQPDAVIIHGWWHYTNREAQVGVVSLSALYMVRKLLGIKLAALLFDQARNNFVTSDILASLCDWVFTHEHPTVFRKFSKFPDKHIVSIATFSPSLFHGDPAAARDIDISFVGGTSGYGNSRGNALDVLRQEGIKVAVPGGRSVGQQRLTNQEYAAFIHRSKIVLNWSKHISGRWYQAKGRIFETTLAGSMLLCEECEPVNMWLRPGIDYVPFSNVGDLVEKARYYLDHEEQRRRIAQCGHATAMKKFHADVLWGQMISRMRQESLFCDKEAICSLQRYATDHELDVARFLVGKLRGDEMFVRVGEIAAIVEYGNRSLVRKFNWWLRCWSHRMRTVRMQSYFFAITTVGSFIPPEIRSKLRKIFN